MEVLCGFCPQVGREDEARELLQDACGAHILGEIVEDCEWKICTFVLMDGRKSEKY